MQEHTNLPYASIVEGKKMHACGRDGHATMLLGAARYLADNRDFDGTVVLIFRPAEEADGGGLAMVRDGLMDRFGIQTVFAIHNSPNLAVGYFSTCTGGIMGSADLFEVNITGKGCHAALPDQGVDPAIAIAQIIQGFQTIVSRSVSSAAQYVVIITQIRMGSTDKIIAETAHIRGTVRCLSREARVKGKERMAGICNGVAEMTGTDIDFNYMDDVPVTHNDPDQTQVALDAAASIVDPNAVDGNRTPTMGAKDFSFILGSRLTDS